MAFRKRNVSIQGQSASSQAPTSPGPDGSSSAASLPRRDKNTAGLAADRVAGVRPSPFDGRPTVSTGTPSLDGLLAGHAGLTLGNSILIEEHGTTDYGGTLLRYYAAEGVLQGHSVHVVGTGEPWARELPGLASTSGGDGGGKREEESTAAAENEKMKIAWRYERLAGFGAESARAPPLPQRSVGHTDVPRDAQLPPVFCHSFDLTKRLTLPSPTAIHHIPIRTLAGTTSPFDPILEALKQHIEAADHSSIHRIVIPNILSPVLYPECASLPEHILQFLHSLRSLLRHFRHRLTAMISLPLTLYPRDAGLTRWIERLSDGVIELIPFPHTVDAGPSLSASGAATAKEEKPQGMAKIHKVPVFHERGGGGGAGSVGVGDDLAFTVTRKRFVIKPFSLPPVEGDTEAQAGELDGKATKLNIDF